MSKIVVIAYAKCAPVLRMTGCIRNFKHRKCTKHALTGITRYLINLRNNKIKNKQFIQVILVRQNCYSK